MYFKKNDKIGIYTVAFPHKQGSYAETYRVKDTSGKTRFLKLINYSKLNRNQIDDNGRVIEVEIAKLLNHHNLCQFIDSGNMMMNGGQYAWFVTEFVSGETLSQRIIRDDEISVYEIKTIAKAVLSALSFLHSQTTPIIHNEVTIQNVFLNLVGELQNLKLIDFGYARFLNQSPAKPDLDELNPFYLAPERFSGVCSIQTDLYSVGVMMYHLLYGELPWFLDVSRRHGQDVIDSILAERDKELELTKEDKYELDDQLLNVIAKSLSYDSEDRFQSADEFIKAIDGEVKIERQSTKRKILSQQQSDNTPATLKSRYVNATQENIAKMFKEAEENAPTVIFIDEMNELVPNRDDGNVHEMSRSAVNEMLAQMDRTGEKGIFIIGATNYPNMIDPAILRAGRLDKKYYIGVPDIEARMALFKLYLEKRPYDFGLDYQQLADMTQNYVSADIQLIVNDASRNALRQHSKITMEILKAAITNTTPSLSNNELRKYERIRAMMNGEEIKKSDDRPRIGFNV